MLKDKLIEIIEDEVPEYNNGILKKVFKELYIYLKTQRTFV